MPTKSITPASESTCLSADPLTDLKAVVSIFCVKCAEPIGANVASDKTMAKVELRTGLKFSGKLCSRCIQSLGGSRIDRSMNSVKEREKTYSKGCIIKAMETGRYQDFAVAFADVEKSIAQIDKAILRLRDKLKIAIDGRNEIVAIRDEAVQHAQNTPSCRYFIRRLEADKHISRDSVRARILARDGRSCVRCQCTNDLTLDHIISVLNGGTDEDANLQVLCRRCNSSKGSK